MRKRHEQGAALLLVILLIAVLLVYGSTLLQTMVGDARLVAREEKRLQAYYLARAGAAALAAWIQDNPGQLSAVLNKASDPVSFGAGTFWVAVDGTEGSDLLINATGEVDGVTESVAVRLTPQAAPTTAFDMAVFSLGSIDLSGSAHIIGTVGTNSEDPGSVSFNGAAGISGDLFVGPNANVADFLDKEGRITGEVRNLPAYRTYTLPPFPEFPDLTQPGGSGQRHSDSLTVGNHQSFTLWEDAQFEDITVQRHGILRVDISDGVRLLRVKNLNFKGSLILWGSGTLILYVENSLKLDGEVNGQGAPEQLIMYYKGAQELRISSDKFTGSIYANSAAISLSSKGEFKGHILTGGSSVDLTGNASIEGMVLAPEAKISVGGNGKLRGCVISESLDVNGNATIEYDDSVATNLPAELLGVGGSSGECKVLWL